MQHRTLGSTGLRVSVIGIGTWQFGGEWAKQFEQAEVDAMFDKARELDINLIDTAECYGDHTSEAFIGHAIHRDRDKSTVATKFGHKFHKPFERDTVYDPDLVQQQLEASLRALRTDYVDLYQFHSGSDDMFKTEGLWDRLTSLKKQGKIKHLGISIGSNQNIFQPSQATQVGAEAIQVVYNRLDRGPEAEVLPSCLKQNLGVLARVPLASGFLSGKYKPGHKFPDADVREKWMKDNRDAKLKEVQTIAENEVPANVPMAQWALAWVLKHPAITCVIPGCKNVEQVANNAAVADLDITPNR